MPDILLGLILVQTVQKGYQQMTLVGKDLTNISLVLFVGHGQTVYTQIRCHRNWALIRVTAGAWIMIFERRNNIALKNHDTNHCDLVLTRF